MKIVVLDGFTVMQGDLTFDFLKPYGEVTVYERTEASEVIDRLKGAEIAITNKTVIDKAVMEACPELKFISVLATGYNVVDIAASKEKGIVISNVPSYSTDSVAQHTFALLLELVAHVGEHSRAVFRSQWASSKDFCFCLSHLTELSNKTMAIIGYGNIGKAVEKIAKAFNMNVLIHNRTPFEGSVSLETALKEADIVSLHCPLTDNNAKMINAKSIALMKSDALLINTSRGALIDEDALADALNGGQIAGAGLDVLSTEPPSRGNPLLISKNCIITPHIAWATGEARKRLLNITEQNVKSYVNGEPINVVNK